MSKPEHFAYVNASPNDTEKKRRIDELKAKFLSGNFSGAANFAAACDDVGNPDGIYDCDFATFNQKAAEYTAIQNIKRLTLIHSVKDSVRQYILQSNSVRAANRAKKAERDAQKKDKFVSHPNWF